MDGWGAFRAQVPVQKAKPRQEADGGPAQDTGFADRLPCGEKERPVRPFVEQMAALPSTSGMPAGDRREAMGRMQSATPG